MKMSFYKMFNILNIEIYTFIGGIGAVSYTHLDVYKRQVIGIFLGSIFSNFLTKIIMDYVHL